MSRRARRRRIAAGAAAPLLAAALLGAGAASAQNQPSFTGVGDLPGGTVGSIAEAVSDDGTVVVGGSDSAAGPEAFRWTRAGGLQGLGDLPGGIFSSHATGVSANGAVIVGTGVNSSDDSRAVRWSGGSTTALGAFFCIDCPSLAFAHGVSANGSVVVGSGTQKILLEDVSLDAARWPSGGTSISNLGHLSGGGEVSEAYGASANGSVIVGSSDASAGVRAFRWTSGGGMNALADVPGAQVSATAYDVSDDGQVVVGFANTATNGTYQREAVRWVAPGFAPELLGALPGASAPGSRARAVSPDGSRIVGSANDDGGDDAAFLWDAASGMRPLAEVLEQEYGLDLAGWRLVEARGISAVNAAGEFTVVGDGVNPAGQPEGWVALLSPTACNDGLDNDGDGLFDHPEDPDCLAPGDRSETADCGDGLDNDGDGLADHPVDPGCTSPLDATERFDCSDGVDNDADGLVDHPADAGCRGPEWGVEDPDCQNGLDDDGDGRVDFPADLGCVVASDLSERPDCNNGLDDDGDGLTDAADPHCVSTSHPSEFPACSDGLDNDDDGATDWPAAHPACQGPDDAIERPACLDGLDDDGDGLVDGADPGCLRARYGREDPVVIGFGDLLVLDRRSDTLLRLDVASGAQTPISVGAALGEPQGLAVRPSGAIVVADPAGLFEIAPGTGAQRRLTGPLAASLSLQLVFDAAGDAVVLTANGLLRAPWAWAGPSATAPLLTLPVPGSIGVFQGDALAREASGALLVGGFGLLGDGIYRVAADGSSTSKLTPGLSGDIWQDLAVEPDGSVLAAGTRFGVGPGVFRVHPGTGAITALATGPDWTAPSAVAVAPDGRIFAADAGACGAGGCTGAEVVELSPTTGARLHVATGGAITGETDLAVVSALPACNNGLDDDGAGGADFPADSHCEDFHDPSELPGCANGLDDDGDGLVDFPADPGCAGASSDREAPACDDGRDNDRDGSVDWDGGPNGEPPDPYCNAASKTAEQSSCGLGAELALLLPLLRAWRRRRRT